MNRLSRIFTIIFLIGSIILGIILYLTLSLNNNSNKDIKFSQAINSTEFLNYYIERKNFDFFVDTNALIIKNKSGQELKLKKDDLIENFLGDWSVYENKWYPKNSCEFIRISVPFEIKTMSNGQISLYCLEKIDSDQYLNLSK
jgi:hypothetical protein